MINVAYVNKHQILMFGSANFHFDYFECPADSCDSVDFYYKNHLVGGLMFDKGRLFMKIMGARNL